jgi:hypothetical protein
MAEEPKVTETVAKVEPKTEAPAQASETLETLTAKLMEAERKAQNKAEEAERHFKKLARFEADETKRKEAEMTEMQKLQAELAKRDAELQALLKTNLRRDAAKQAGLSETFATRLQGDTLEEMIADAKLLAEAMPKPAAATVGMTQPAGQTRLTLDAIKKMSPQDINKNWEAVSTAMAQK